MSIVKIKWLLILLLLGNFLNAQKYVIKNFGVSEGLGQSQVQAITQDELGFLWVGTLGGGVSKFDGTSFENYTRKDGLVSNFVLSFSIQKDKSILVGTSNGLSKITTDSIYSKFTNSPLDSLIVQSIQSSYISTSSGLFTYKNNTTIPFNNKGERCGKGIYNIAKDDKYIWGATNHGIIEISDSLVRCRTDLNKVHNNYFTSTLKDNKGNIWVGSLGGGITKLDQNGKNINYSKKQGLYSYNVTCLFEDSKSNIWIGSSGQGVSKFDGKTFTQITKRNGLANDYVNTIFEDKLGNIWFGTSNGLSKFEGEKYVMYDESSFIPGGGGYVTLQTQDKSIWIGTLKGGLIQYKNNHTKYYNRANGFTSKRIKSLYEDKKGILWIGTDGSGLYSYKEGRFKKENIGNVWVRDIKADASGKLYIATLGNGLITIYNDTVTGFTIEKGLLSNRINKIAITDTVWLATDEGACYYKDDSIFVLKNIPKERFVTFTTNNNGTLFFGNIGQGVYVLKNGEVTNLNSNNGLSSDNIYAIYSEQNKLWVGTEKGLDELTYNREGEIVSNIKHTIKEGFLGIELLRGSIYKDYENNYWFGTVNGLVKYNPKEGLKANNSIPNLILTSVELLYEPLQEASILGGDLELKNNKFSYNQNHFTFRFKGIDLNSTNTLMFRWRLLGFDDVWNTPTSQQFATYNNLSAGKFTFEVQVKGQNGNWSNSIKQTIIIAKPYWQATWFVVLLTLLLLVLIWVIISYYIKKNKAKNEKLKVDLHIIELEQQALRLQMNPHFLFNSLNAIKGAVAQQQTKEAKKAIDNFAKLMRSMLENTNEGFVPLGKEINLIKQYLDLELLNNEFNYEINSDEVSDDTLIPAMMIQPIVENAVLHGVSSLKGEGNINVVFKRIENQTLLCQIIDDGIGREASQRIKNESVHKQESKAIGIIKSRLKIMKKSKATVGIKMEDGIGGKGTIVSLHLPIKNP